MWALLLATVVLGIALALVSAARREAHARDDAAARQCPGCCHHCHHHR